MDQTQYVDTLIVGNGPSALILSFILHGNIPYYDPTNPHPDPILHGRLSKSPCILDADVDELTAHFAASRISYSTQALPINVLLDTLIRPLADTEPGLHASCIEWRNDPSNAVDHAVIGSAPAPGGQWAENPVKASWDIGTLSYAEMLSLPKYSFAEHLKRTGKDEACDFWRPRRRDVADYLAAYPRQVGIEDTLWPSSRVSGIVAGPDGGFYAKSHRLYCKHLVIASGIFSRLIPARPQLKPLLELTDGQSTEPPLLVVGSGFSAADIIITNAPRRKIIHIFKWAPEEHPSPLRACHPTAYPEYAAVYRRMKTAAIRALGADSICSPLLKRRGNHYFDQVDWETKYEGFPNTWIEGVHLEDGMARVTLRTAGGQLEECAVGNLEYVIGRRGDLLYLSPELQERILGPSTAQGPAASLVSGKSLRRKAEQSLEVAPNTFVIGSLAGDSLIRYSYGTCVSAAKHIIFRQDKSQSIHERSVRATAARRSSVAHQARSPDGTVLMPGTSVMTNDVELQDLDQPESALGCDDMSSSSFTGNHFMPEVAISSSY